MNGSRSIADLADRARLPWRFQARAVAAVLGR